MYPYDTHFLQEQLLKKTLTSFCAYAIIPQNVWSGKCVNGYVGTLVLKKLPDKQLAVTAPFLAHARNQKIPLGDVRVVPRGALL